MGVWRGCEHGVFGVVASCMWGLCRPLPLDMEGEGDGVRGGLGGGLQVSFGCR